MEKRFESLFVAGGRKLRLYHSLRRDPGGSERSLRSGSHSSNSEGIETIGGREGYGTFRLMVLLVNYTRGLFMR